MKTALISLLIAMAMIVTGRRSNLRVPPRLT